MLQRRLSILLFLLSFSNLRVNGMTNRVCTIVGSVEKTKQMKMKSATPESATKLYGVWRISTARKTANPTAITEYHTLEDQCMCV